MTTELQDEAMDMIVGGAATYMSELAGFIQTGFNGQPCFKVSHKTDISVGHNACPASDKGMELMIRQATRYGKITLTSASGATKDFTAAQLKAMI